MADRKCAYPSCPNVAMSRGTDGDGVSSKRFKWCQFHKKGNGKWDRLKITQRDDEKRKK